VVSTHDDILQLRPCYREQVPGMAVSSAALQFDISLILAAAVNRASVTGRLHTHQALRRVTLARHAGSATTTAQRRVIDTCARAVRAVLGGCMPETVVHREVYE
jgi:hypothetical protein